MPSCSVCGEYRICIRYPPPGDAMASCNACGRIVHLPGHDLLRLENVELMTRLDEHGAHV